MPRKKLIRTNQFPYHICTRSNNKEWFKIPQLEVWQYALDALSYANTKCEVSFHSLVLMNNHYHLLISTPNSDIDTFMYYFNKGFADRLRVRSQTINRIFGGPYLWSLIMDSSYLFNVARYIFQNPVRAGIETRAENYSFSSLKYEFENFNFPVPIKQLFENSNCSAEMLAWYNTLPSHLEDSFIRKGLRKASFAPSKSSNTGKIFELSKA